MGRSEDTPQPKVAFKEPETEMDSTSSGVKSEGKADSAPAPKPAPLASSKAHVVVDGKLSQEEKSRLAGMLGNANAQDTRAFVKQTGKTETLNDYHNKATLVFQGCEDCHYTLAEICTKVFIQDCTNVTLTIDATVVTATVEIYKSKGVTLNINKKVHSLQLDISENISAVFRERSLFDNLVWAGTEDIELTVGEEKYRTGYAEMAAKDKTVVFERTQFKTWYVANKLITEKVVRLENGFPSTQREVNAFEARQEANMRALMKDMFGDINMTLPRKKKEGPKVGRNDKCPCDSGKKYKSCCGVGGAAS